MKGCKVYKVLPTRWRQLVSASKSTPQVTPQVTLQVTPQVTPQVKREELVFEYCRFPRTMGEIQLYVGMEDREHFSSEVLQPLLEKGLILMTTPDKPTSPKQRYFAKAAP